MTIRFEICWLKIPLFKLFYLAAVSDPYDGFLRALSVSQEKLMPKLEPRIHMKAESFNT